MVGKGIIVAASFAHSIRLLVWSLATRSYISVGFPKFGSAIADCKKAVRLLTRVAKGKIFARLRSEIGGTSRIPLSWLRISCSGRPYLKRSCSTTALTFLGWIRRDLTFVVVRLSCVSERTIEDRPVLWLTTKYWHIRKLAWHVVSIWCRPGVEPSYWRRRHDVLDTHARRCKTMRWLRRTCCTIWGMMTAADC